MFEQVGASVVYYNDGGSIGLLIFLVFFWIIFAAAGYVLTSFFLMRVFDKAGVQGKWRAWVPIYNGMIFLKLGDLSPWLLLYAIGASILLGWIPVVGQLILLATFILTLMAAWRVGLKLQKEAVWLILYFFLSIVWLGIVAFDKSRWNTAIPAAPWAGNGFLGDRTNWEGIPSQVPAGGYPANPATSPAPGYAAPPAPPTGYAPPAAQPPASPEPPAAPDEPKA
ncbi:large exoprotein [Microbacterium schleiferi]|uniref:Large exoprotein n=1 Tax=Microbacterium schleiferi TaxID=69362 RepID=A0ABU7V1X4_9MICO